MVWIRMPAPPFFQAQLGPEWLSEILEGLEDRMRHKLVLLAKNNGTDTQLSNRISETWREHSDCVGRPRTCCVGRKGATCWAMFHLKTWHISQSAQWGENTLYLFSMLDPLSAKPLCCCVRSHRFHLLVCGRKLFRLHSEIKDDSLKVDLIWR